MGLREVEISAAQHLPRVLSDCAQTFRCVVGKPGASRAAAGFEIEPALAIPVSTLKDETMNQEFKYQHPGTGITPELNYVIRLLKHEAERAHAAGQYKLSSKLTDLAIHIESGYTPVKPLNKWPEI